MNALEIIGAEALRMIEAGEATLIDVRTPVEFSSLHALPAKNLPINLLTKERLEEIAQLKKIIFICQSGGRGKKAVELATGFGFSPSNVSGGTLAWSAAGLPIEQGENSISIERQVRIVAGALVAVGILAGIFIAPALLAIPLFVGCGLVYAGITDTCAMGMLLARMPWNNKLSICCSTIKR